MLQAEGFSEIVVKHMRDSENVLAPGVTYTFFSAKKNH